MGARSVTRTSKVQIERLLDHLRRDQHLAGPRVGRAALAERRGHVLLDLQPIDERESGMEQAGIETARLEGGVRLERVVHRIADVEDGLAGACRTLDFVQGGCRGI